MAIAFGIFAIIFGVCCVCCADGDDKRDQAAVPYLFALSVAFLVASTVLGLH